MYLCSENKGADTAQLSSAPLFSQKQISGFLIMWLNLYKLGSIVQEI